LIESVEAGGLKGACDFRKKLITAEYEEKYRERIENSIKKKDLSSKLCSKFQGGPSEVEW
jgi:hypothetical protein